MEALVDLFVSKSRKLNAKYGKEARDYSLNITGMTRVCFVRRRVDSKKENIEMLVNYARRKNNQILSTNANEILKVS